MVEESKQPTYYQIITDIKPGKKINFKLLANGNEGLTVAQTNSLTLQRDKLYFIPITTNVNSDEFSSIKLLNEYSQYFDVRGVKDGCAIIIPLVHNYQLEDDKLIGYIW